MIKGSRNSMSYLETTWMTRLAKKRSRCQSKSIAEQYAAGIRVFDIHLRFDWDGTARLVNGWAKYVGETPFEVLKWLNLRSSAYDRISVRLVLDCVMHESWRQQLLFDLFSEKMSQTFYRLDFTIGDAEMKGIILIDNI